MTDSVEHVAVPIEDEVKTENAEGGEGEVKTESTEGGEGKPSQEEAMLVTSETVVTNETETGVKYEIDDELPWAMYRSMDTPPQRTPVEEDEDWPASDDDDDYGNLFEIIIFAFHKYFVCAAICRLEFQRMLLVNTLDSHSRGPRVDPRVEIVLCSWSRHIIITVPLSTS